LFDGFEKNPDSSILDDNVNSGLGKGMNAMVNGAAGFIGYQSIVAAVMPR
jgi:hypothetical protein